MQTGQQIVLMSIARDLCSALMVVSALAIVMMPVARTVVMMAAQAACRAAMMVMAPVMRMVVYMMSV
jgi:hypothetical protein